MDQIRNNHLSYDCLCIISVTKDKIKSNCFHINYKLLWKAYENKLKTSYEHVIKVFSYTLSNTLTSVNK